MHLELGLASTLHKKVVMSLVSKHADNMQLMNYYESRSLATKIDTSRHDQENEKC